MQFVIFAGLLVLTASASFLENQGVKFQDFKLKYGKTYLNQAEEAKRFNIFQDNVQAIEEHNALYEQGKVPYKKGINKFTDMTEEEFKAMLKFSSSTKPNFEAFGIDQYNETGVEVPASVDWRDKGVVTEIKDQGQCGSCWSFSVTGATEAAYAKKTGKLVSLSEQQLIDCTLKKNHGCNGGFFEPAFLYVKENGLQSESNYPFEGANGKCRYSASDVVTKISKFTFVRADEKLVLEAVATKGPVATSMISTPSLSAYSSGIYEESSCSKGVNHAVLIVGYGTENGTDYWLVKNTWGATWGEKGYFRIVRGKKECGICNGSFYATVN